MKLQLLASDMKSWLTEKVLDIGKKWRQKERGATEAEMVRLHDQHNGHEFEQTLGDSEEQGSPWDHKE